MHAVLFMSASKALQASHRARSSYMELSKFFRSYGTTSAKVECPKGHVSRGLITPRVGAQRRRGLHQEQVQRAAQESNEETAEILETYMDSMLFPRATHEIREMPNLPLETVVVLHGYLGASVNLSKVMTAVPLISKDLDCSIQIISTARNVRHTLLPNHSRLKKLRPHTPVALTGILRKRGHSEDVDGESMKKIKTVEIQMSKVQSLNGYPSDIIITPETVFPPEKRHLQLRTEKGLRNALAVRAKVASVCRDELGEKQGFMEVETPILFKSTAEGAKEFIVPTRRKGLAYALPQSPQQYKQILMASGVSRYYQLAKCFRDEDLRADRQPEFTQLDLEMSFASGADVMHYVENLVKRLWKEVIGVDLPASFPRMTYHAAMAMYGSDKPDTRLGMSISRVENHLPADLISKLSPLADPPVEAMVFPLSEAPNSNPNFSRTFIAKFLDSPEAAPFRSNPAGSPGIFVYDPKQPLEGLQSLGFEAASSLTSSLPLQPGDVLILQALAPTDLIGNSTALGNLRLALHKAAVKSSLLPPPTGFSPLWITHFPLFTPASAATEPSQTLLSTHHPFTSPHSLSDVSLLLRDPHLALADHYDLVVNGVELGGGSRRIHHAAMQSYILRDILRLPPARLAEFSHLIEVLRAGCPPHAGMALGFDRLVAVLLGRASVRDVIAFPKSGRGEDVLVKSPGAMSEDVLERYHLSLRE